MTFKDKFSDTYSLLQVIVNSKNRNLCKIVLLNEFDVKCKKKHNESLKANKTTLKETPTFISIT